ncbi:hypothetical protein T4E_11228 [Trichinella pseudospiralis]|uniref:Uncharacterized protein n=1 Tax=Trichinella pseudospiralis TaxID=6337 RepID=A0A0V0XNA1_TRIPS|nr:hypothetical protein T4E_11228 [Trichinella pseudospiralis]
MDVLVIVETENDQRLTIKHRRQLLKWTSGFIVLSSVGGVGISSGRRMDNGALLTNVRKALAPLCFCFTKGKWKARQFGAGRVCESVKATPSASSSECVAVEFGQVRPRAWADQLGAWFGYLFRTMSGRTSHFFANDVLVDHTSDRP